MDIIENKKTAITNATVFDSIRNRGILTGVFAKGRIISIGQEIPPDADVIDGTGATLLPGLIDAHTHTSVDSLRCALKFGVTTELEMMGDSQKAAGSASCGASTTSQMSAPPAWGLPLRAAIPMSLFPKATVFRILY